MIREERESSSPAPRRPLLGRVGVAWGLLGVLLLLGQAIFRLGATTLAALRLPWTWHHWAFTIPWVPLMLFFEGYQGFSRGFSPRVAARAAYLRDHPSALRVVFAPLFCIGYFGIERKRQLGIIGATAVMLGLVVVIHLIAQPWRGAIDLGVVAGLLWGIVALAIACFRRFRTS